MPAAPGSLQACACTLGDDAGFGKLQLDPRLPEGERRRVEEAARSAALRTRLLPMKGPRADAVSAVLAAAYHAVTRMGALKRAAPAP